MYLFDKIVLYLAWTMAIAITDLLLKIVAFVTSIKSFCFSTNLSYLGRWIVPRQGLSLESKSTIFPSFHAMFMRFTHIDKCKCSFSMFIFIAVYYLIVQMWHNLFILLAMDIWVVSWFGLLQMTLLWTFICMSVGAHVHTFLGGIHLEVELLD